ncbi:MAG: 16S rRNA (uracil(1498)-N(3))-methyltransferase [Cyclobacteriaceae bacterium]
MTIFYQPEVQQGIHELDQEESRHCVKVLRKQEGDMIQIADGRGYFYQARITFANARQCKFEILHTEKIAADPFRIHIAISPTKNNERTEWFVEKAVEMGVHRISFLLCENSERRVLKTDRLEKKVISAMKQAQQAYLPEIRPLLKFNELVKSTDEAEKFIAYLGEEPSPYLARAAKPGTSYLVLIGPEGDFSPEEVQTALNAGFKPVSLGNSRLRTETAGIAACHTLQLVQLMS